MTLTRSNEPKTNTLTEDEWNELQALKDAINYNPSQVHYEKMELFADLLVRSLQERGG